jgi:hypothetical protein
MPLTMVDNRLVGLPKLIQEVVSQAAHTHYGNAGCMYSPNSDPFFRMDACRWIVQEPALIYVPRPKFRPHSFLDIMMLRAGVQALSNLLTGNQASKDDIWYSLLVQVPSPSCDQNLLRHVKSWTCSISKCY